MKRHVLIWDLPTRIFHWLLVIGISVQYITAEWMDDAIDWHFTIGYCVLSLVLFRLCWGIVGTRYAKFNALNLNPSSTLDYAKTLPQRNSPKWAGHNPVGSWAVVLMLLLIALQAISGLFVTDDIFSEGPYRSLASDDIKAIMAFIHFNFFDVLLGLIGIHVVAALVYQFYKKQPIITAMVTGKKPVSEDGITNNKIVLAIVTAAVVAAAVYLVVEVLPPEPEFYF